MRTHLSTLLRLLVACGLGALLLHGVRARALLHSLHAAHPWLLALALLLCLADRALMIGKWYPLLTVQVPGVPLGRAVRAYLAAGFASYFLPASVGADALRSFALGRGRGAVAEVGASVVLERLLGLLGSAVLVLAALLFALRGSPRLAPLLPWAVGVLALGLGLLAAILFRRPAARLLARLPAATRNRFWHLLHRLAAAGERYRGARSTVAVVAVLSAVEQLVPVLVLTVLAGALALPIPWQALFVAVPLALFLGRLPITFAGLGVFEGTLVALLGLYRVARPDALALGLAARVFEVAAQLPGALFWRDLAGSARAPAAAGMAPETDPRPAGEPLRVLMITDKLGYKKARFHGAGRLTVEWATAFPPDRVEMHTYVLRDLSGVVPELCRQGIPIQVFLAHRFNPWLLVEMVRTIRRLRIDVLHLQEYGASTLGRLAALLTGRPVVLHVHASYDRAATMRYPWYVRWVDHLLAPATTHAVAVSESVRRFSVEQMGLRPERTSALHNPAGRNVAAAVSEAEVEDLRRRYGLSTETPVVGAITRFYPLKGNRFLLDAFARLAPLLPAARLLLVGDGPDRQELADQARELGIAERVIFAGFRQDVAAHLRLFWVATLPSLEEGLPMVVVEALMAGVPVVATRVGGIGEVVEPGRNGFLVDPADPAGLADALYRVLADPDLRERLRQGCRADRERFSMDHFTARMEEVYRQAAAAGPRAGRTGQLAAGGPIP